MTGRHDWTAESVMIGVELWRFGVVLGVLGWFWPGSG